MAWRTASGTRDGITERFYSEMDRYQVSDEFDARERMAIEYTEKFALDHLSLDDAYFQRLREYFDDGEVLDLTVYAGRCLAMGRLTAVLGLGVTCPVEFPSHAGAAAAE